MGCIALFLFTIANVGSIVLLIYTATIPIKVAKPNIRWIHARMTIPDYTRGRPLPPSSLLQLQRLPNTHRLPLDRVRRHIIHGLLWFQEEEGVLLDRGYKGHVLNGQEVLVPRGLQPRRLDIVPHESHHILVSLQPADRLRRLLRGRLPLRLRALAGLRLLRCPLLASHEVNIQAVIPDIAKPSTFSLSFL